MTSFSNTSEPFTLQRDCPAILVPAGDAVSLPAGQIGYITQALGGSFTVYVEGNLFRIAGDDADALGKLAPEVPQLPEGAGDADVEKVVWQQLRTCFDPEIPINVVELGLIYECTLIRQDDDRYQVEVKMTLTAPGCGMGEVLVDEVRSKIELIPVVAEADVDLVFDPPWTQHMMSEAARLQTGLF